MKPEKANFEVFLSKITCLKFRMSNSGEVQELVPFPSGQIMHVRRSGDQVLSDHKAPGIKRFEFRLDPRLESTPIFRLPVRLFINRSILHKWGHIRTCG